MVGVLVMRLAARAYAVPLAHVVETMRPLPVEALVGAHPAVAGVAIIRGAPTPVVDLAVLLGLPTRRIGRFVTIRAGGRTVALAVDAVVGVRELSVGQIGEAPPLLQGVLSGVVEALGTLDAELLVVLRASRMVVDDVCAALSE